MLGTEEGVISALGLLGRRRPPGVGLGQGRARAEPGPRRAPGTVPAASVGGPALWF